MTRLFLSILIILTIPYISMLLIVGAFLFWFGRFIKDELLEKYGFSIAYTVDQMANTLLMGQPDMTISMRINLALVSGKPKWFVKPLGKLVDWLALVVAGERDHIAKSDDDSTGKTELWSWVKKP